MNAARTRHHLRPSKPRHRAPVAVAIASILLAAWSVGAADSDLSTTVAGPPSANPGGLATITLGYANAGPDTATNAFVNSYIPSGVPARIDQVTQAQLDALAASATADGLGNAPLLFIEDMYCEHLLFQVQRDDGDTNPDPLVGMTVGASDSVTYALEIPMTQPDLAGVVIDQPASLAHEYKGAVAGQNFLDAAGQSRYSRGGDCDAVTPNCGDLSACFGPRVSLVTPVVADFELADDGTATPTLGCNALVGFTPGNIAVIERGGCEFGVKALNAQNAGAPAAFIVNNGLCGDFPDSDLCVLNMGGGVVGDQVTIPVVQVSVASGQPVIDALTLGTPVSGRIGPVSQTLTLDGTVFLNSLTDTDPVDENNESTWPLGFDAWLFADGFESGDTSAWTSAVP